MNLIIIQILIKIKNASVLKLGFLNIPKTSFGLVLITFLYNNGLIQSYRICNTGITIVVRSLDGYTLTEFIKIVSVPSLKKYLSYNDISKISSPNKIYILSTSLGLQTLLNCKKLKIGGTLLFVC